MTPAEELAAAADKLDALVRAATAGPWTAEAASSIHPAPGGKAYEFTTWLVISPVPDDENPQTAVVAAERNARDGSLTGGCYNEDDAAYIAAMNPLVGKAIAGMLRTFGTAYARETRPFHKMWNEAARERMIGDRMDGFTQAVALARLINGGAS
jgi:hypothetical protein